MRLRVTDLQKLGIMIGVFVLLLGGEGVFAYQCVKNRGNAKKNLLRLDRELKDAEAKQRLMPMLIEKLEELSNIFEEYVAILPSKAEVRSDAFLDDIDRFTQQTGLTIKSAKPVVVKNRATPKAKKGRNTLNFVRHKYRFELEGPFLGLIKFISAIENHSRFLQVDALELRPHSSSGGGQKSDVELAENPRKYLMVEISTYTYSKETKTVEAK